MPAVPDSRLTLIPLALRRAVLLSALRLRGAAYYYPEYPTYQVVMERPYYQTVLGRPLLNGAVEVDRLEVTT